MTDIIQRVQEKFDEFTEHTFFGTKAKEIETDIETYTNAQFGMGFNISAEEADRGMAFTATQERAVARAQLLGWNQRFSPGAEERLHRFLRDNPYAHLTEFTEFVPVQREAPKPLPAPNKSAIAPAAVADGADAEYCKLAKELGFSLPELLQAEFEAFLAANFIEVYCIDRVAEYMTNLVQREMAAMNYRQHITWGWRALRAKDAAFFGLAMKGNYRKPVPKAVLHTIVTIETAFRDRVGFFVSDYEVQKPDPFLMVTAPGLPCYVIERWDEPTFRG